MGRIKYKVLFCSFCLDQNSEQVIDESSFDQNIDVSHLATPHIASNSSLRISANSTPIGDCSSDDSTDRNKHHLPQAIVQNDVDPEQNNCPPELPGRRDIINEATSNSHTNHQRESSQSQPSPSSSLQNNIYELQPSQEPQAQHHPQPSDRDNAELPPQANQRHVANNQPIQAGSATKLSYDIISVREPLAKILAERNQIHIAQSQQRQLLGDHDYIEVYGERGSSCFYEEIAGSTTSSATYDQIGAISNHNYQVLINAYANANRSNVPHVAGGTSDNNNNNNNNNSTNGLNENTENFYDLTSPVDQIDGASNPQQQKPSTSSDTVKKSVQNGCANSQPPIPSDRTSVLSQSIPVYSVINKATRRSNAIIRATIDNCRPPQPPPKNIPVANQAASTSAIQHHHKESSHPNDNHRNARSSPQFASTSSYSHNTSVIPENVEPKKARLPQPPPRYSKLHMYNAANRPLPLPENFENGTGSVIRGGLVNVEDIESIDNGYELLRTNFDDEQIDVGYEKIRECNRYSGGSLSSQFCPLQAIDNGGYESVQPIYSSPANALAEPNYEAIGPTTASELAAAATAKLTAAAAAIEQLLKNDQ